MVSTDGEKFIRGLLECYKGHLSIEDIASGISACISNARELVEDADILIEARRFPRAVSILVAAMEEAGKVSVLCGMARIPTRNQRLWADLWSNFKSHEAKSTHAFVHSYPDDVRTNPDAVLFAAELQAELSPLAERIRQIGLYVDFHGPERRWIHPKELPESEVWSWKRRVEAALCRLEGAEALGLFSPAALKIQREVFGEVNEQRPKCNAMTKEGFLAIRQKAIDAQFVFWRRMVNEGVIEVSADITMMGLPLKEFLNIAVERRAQN